MYSWPLLLASLCFGAVTSAQDSFNATEHPVVLEARASNQIVTTCKKNGQFALTFDDGPFQWENKVDRALQSRKGKGTFFVNGNNYACIYNYAEELQKTYRAGHVIGSHTWSHADITKLSPAQLNTELDRVEVALKKILGVKPALFRPPYGNYNQQTLNLLAKRGYTSIYWNMDPGDTVGASIEQSEAAYRKAASQYPAPGISINHETKPNTVNSVAPYAVKVLADAGYKLVTVSECLGIKPYQKIYTKRLPKRDASWKC